MDYDQDFIETLVALLVGGGFGNRQECVNFVNNELVPFAREWGYEDLITALANFSHENACPGTTEYKVTQAIDRINNRVH